jgi:opacity protein-like surface antigen
MKFVVSECELNRGANQVFNPKSKEFCIYLFKIVLFGCGGALPVAIALAVPPVRAEGTPTAEQPIPTVELAVPKSEVSDQMAQASTEEKLEVAQAADPTKHTDLKSEAGITSPPAVTPPVMTTQDFQSLQSPHQAASLLSQQPVTRPELTSLFNPVAQVPTERPVAQKGSSADSDRWQFSIEPYFFVPLDVKADITAAGRSTSLNANLGDILNLDRAFDAGLRFEARKKRFGVILDGFYLSAGQSGTLGVTFPAGSLQNLGINDELRVDADASAAIRQGRIDLAVFYRALDTSLRKSETTGKTYPRLMIDPIVGLRTNISYQEVEVDRIRVGNLTVPINREFSNSRVTVEPLLGARIELALSDRWTLGVRGDVSGFNINADRDLTWNFLAGVRYRVASHTSLQLAYVFNGYDFKDGSGLEQSKLNLRQQGLQLSVLFRF